jgi:hypothetical protein
MLTTILTVESQWFQGVAGKGEEVRKVSIHF